MEWKKVLLAVEFNAWIVNGRYYAEYEKVFYEETDVTELVGQHQVAIEEELANEYPKTGENLYTAFRLYLPFGLVKEMEKETIIKHAVCIRKIEDEYFMDYIEQ